MSDRESGDEQLQPQAQGRRIMDIICALIF